MVGMTVDMVFAQKKGGEPGDLVLDLLKPRTASKGEDPSKLVAEMVERDVPGKPSRDKGARGERELAALIGATKISGMYKPGNDLEWKGYEIEVKRYQQPISKKLDKLLQDCPIVMERADGGQWVAHLRVTDLLDLMDL